jgi:hypothetical protein
MDLFERNFSTAAEDIEFELRGKCFVPWSDFWLNPRRLRGSDFLMRWSQGVWSERRLIEAINETEDYYALAYGPSGTVPEDVRGVELYFERLEAAGLGATKRPDLLIFRKADEVKIKKLIDQIGGKEELPFTSEDNPKMIKILSRAILAVECENSLWKAALMPNFNTELTPQKRLDGKLGLKKTAVLPTVIIKEEDRAPLRKWQAERGVVIHIWHVFYDLAYGIALNTIEKLIKTGKIMPTVQVFQAPGGATTQKTIYKIYYHYAYPLGEANKEPELVAACIIDKNGHILPYVVFKGGKLKVKPEALKVLKSYDQ